METWRKRYDTNEYVDTMSPFERVIFLLGQLVENGAEWSGQKRAALRRTLYGFTQQSVGSMPLHQQDILNRTILADQKVSVGIGSPKPDEKKLIEQWIKDTVGRGVK